MNDATNVGPIRGLFRSVFTKVPMIKHITAPSGTYGFNNPALTLFELHDPKKFDHLEVEVKERIRGKIAKTSNDLIAPEIPKTYPF